MLILVSSSRYLITYKSKAPISVAVVTEPGKSYDINGLQVNENTCKIEAKEESILPFSTVASSKEATTNEFLRPYYSQYPYDYFDDYGNYWYHPYPYLSFNDSYPGFSRVSYRH